jgi:hypothetical protein
LENIVAMDANAGVDVDHDLDIPVLPLFVQLNIKVGGSNETTTWRESSRWVKFQEDVEDGGKRWSKPFVPAVPLSAILDLRHCLLDGIVAFDIQGYNIVDILGKTSYISCIVRM